MDKKKKILIAFGSLAALYGLALLIFWVAVKIKENIGIQSHQLRENDKGFCADCQSCGNAA